MIGDFLVKEHSVKTFDFLRDDIYKSSVPDGSGVK